MPDKIDPHQLFSKDFLNLLFELHQKYTPWQKQLILARQHTLMKAHEGLLPNYLPDSRIRNTSWNIKLPPWCEDQRNQMTGPADDNELVVKMLNSGAPGVMLDLEDSMANVWNNLLQGYDNILAALHSQLSYFDKKREKEIHIQSSPTVIYTRPRGLHISQAGLFENEIVSASLFDVAYLVYHFDPSEVKHPLCFYIPKSESAEEAKWWASLFKDLAASKKLSPNYIKCMALVESHPMAYQFEEFMYHLQDHIIGLNLGRWDYMASLIHYNINNPKWLLPDRNSIPHNISFFQNLRMLIPQVCHRRGILAIGGMTALYPSRIDPNINERALTILAQDKKNEADCFMDGAWTGHPDQNEIAVSQFPYPNQLSKTSQHFERFPDLRPPIKEIGQYTTDGTRSAIRTIIRYRHGYLSGRGASLINGYMEDLATDRIYRLMVYQRMKHSSDISIVDDTGKSVIHSPEFITALFHEELQTIIREFESDNQVETKQYIKASDIGLQMIIHGVFDPM